MRRISFLPIFLAFFVLVSCQKNKPIPATEDSPVRSALEEMATFQIEPGFKVQLVASEPLIEDPILIQFDEDGRLWVVEMRGYMSDIEGSEEDLPIGRISILEDQDGDGEMDKSTIYLDSLVMPRALGFIKGGALVAENNSLWITQDLDGDLKADSKILLDSTYAANGIPEHSDNGFVRNVDNWYYSAKSSLRYRVQNGTWVRDSTEARGQYGIFQDDQGRLIYNYNWSQLHGDLVPPNYLSRNPNHKPSTGIDHGLSVDRRVYPIRPTLGVNRGYIPSTLDSTGRLREFTSACSPVVYRSKLFPKEYHGNIFVMENAGNLVKRNVMTQQGNLLVAHDPNPGTEFFASTDERFRPVHGTVGPDGALYIVDMYHGIVQHDSYMTPYLKEQILMRDLDKGVHLGRIWRIVPEDWAPSPAPKLSKKSNQELLEFLGHQDGWYRDMAQRLLVERADLSVVERLEALARSGKDQWGAFHALWTLEGLDAVNPAFGLTLLASKNALIQTAALRILEKAANENSTIQAQLGAKMSQLAVSASEELALQLALSAHVLLPVERQNIISSVIQKYGDQALIRDAAMSSLGDQEFNFLKIIWESQYWINSNPGNEIFLENLTAAIAKKGNPSELKELLELVNVNSRELGWKSKVILTGLAIQAASPSPKGQIVLKSEPDVFKRKDLPLDKNRLEMLRRMFSWPGFKPTTLASSEAFLDESALKQYAEGRQKYLTSCAGCHGSNGAGATRMGPPLAGSEWVTGDEKRLVLLLLHGIEGPIEVAGKKYDAPEILPVMPSHSAMDDASIAAILTYIRNEWGNQGSPVTGRIVGGTRHTSQGRVYPWTAAELNAHVEKLRTQESK
jgi:mono/diheme cytochrome c family protein/glucose/arabinose dehydrogenase